MRARTILSVNSADVGGGAERVAAELHRSYLAHGEDAWLAVGSVREPAARTVAVPNRTRRSAWTRAWMSAADALPRLPGSERVGRFLRGPIAEPGRWAARARGHEDFDFPGTKDLLSLPPRRPDVVHLHNLHGGYFDLRALPSLAAAVPTIVTLHDAWMFSGHCAHSFACDRWTTGCGRCPALWIYPAVPADQTAANWRRKQAIFAASRLHVATPSEWLAERVRRSMLMPAVRELRVIPAGVDLQCFTPGSRAAARQALGLDPSRALMLTTEATLRENSWRDYEMFRDALGQRHGGAGEHWVAIGAEGPNVRFGGITVERRAAERDPRRLALWYQAADAFVHVPRADTFPLMVIEALACGTPVLAAAVGGVPEQIVSAALTRGALEAVRPAEPTGVLVPAGDASALAAALDAFVALTPAARDRLGDAAAADARRRFDKERHAEAYLAWMRELVPSTARPHVQ